MTEPTPADTPENPYSTMLAIIGGGVAIALIIFAVAFLVNDGKSDDASTTTAVVSSGPTRLTEMEISGRLSVPAGGELHVVNDGSIVHDLKIEGDGKTAELEAGGSETLPIDLSPGSYVVYCTIEGHRSAGMEAELTVTP